jgi:7,8-dihydropterin-6-yl-methyl-4-(beta-D-ribofuranosyl)aminobenzene 5'-phosphate synthase
LTVPLYELAQDSHDLTRPIERQLVPPGFYAFTPPEGERRHVPNSHWQLKIKSLRQVLLSMAVIVAGDMARASDASSTAELGRVHSLKITVLSTMLADNGELGEWGFSALVEADGHRILYDTGAHTEVVLRNAESLNIDLTTVPEVVLSHNHSDHVGGFLTLRHSVVGKAPGALARTHVGEGIFYPRSSLSPGIDENQMRFIRDDYEKTGGVFVVHREPVQLYPGIWLTGPVPRKYPEHNWPKGTRVTTPTGIVEDYLPEDMALVCDTDNGLVVLTGCGHAGVINIIDYSRTFIRPARVHALIGGTHLFNASEETLSWTAEKLRSFGVDNLLGAHCTGLETVYRFRRDLGLDRAHAVVAAVGSSFELGKGIDPLNIAR